MTEAIILSNRYRLEEQLGSGGMSIVYRAHDLMLERTVAIKLLRKDYSNNPQFRQQFRQEAKAAASLSHPNIVTVHDFGLDSNQLFIIMEYVPGNDLKSLLREKGRIDLAVSVDLMIQACAGIGYAHRAGLVHCDIKPQNMLVTPDLRLKVADFGIARALASISPDEKTEIVWGSPHYFSPEQAAGNAPSPASDVYSLGIVFYEMLTGQLPFKGETPEQLADQHRLTLPPSPRRINAHIPPSLEQVILKVLSKEPSARYRTADQLGSVLRNSLSQAYFPSEEANNQAVPTLDNREIPENDPEPWQTQSDREYSTPASYQPYEPVITILEEDQERVQDFDWITWGLALLALIAAGGLIPFLLWVFYILNPPI
jgi:serine/threonine-protein kinase